MIATLKEVPQQIKDTIFGYLRGLSSIDIDKLSNDIIDIIILYYYIHFKFDTNNGKYSIINIYVCNT